MRHDNLLKGIDSVSETVWTVGTGSVAGESLPERPIATREGVERTFECASTNALCLIGQALRPVAPA